MRLPRELLTAVPRCTAPRFDLSPLQVGLGGSPWHVTVASMLMVRVPRRADVIAHVFNTWETPELMACSDAALADSLRPLGLHVRRARTIQQLCRRWTTNSWSDLRDLKGVGPYVAAAVELFCFNYPGHSTCDHVLADYANKCPVFPMMREDHDEWFVDCDQFLAPLEAYREFAARKLTVPA